MDLSNAELADLYLAAKARKKEAEKAVKRYEAELDRRLKSGDRLELPGRGVFEWVVSVTGTTQYRAVLEWVVRQAGPDVGVLVEEGRELPSLKGTRVTRELKKL